MADNLLTLSNLNLFGLIMEDIDIMDYDKPWKVRLASTDNVTPLTGLTPVSGVPPKAGDFVLLTAQTTAAENGLYRVPKVAGAWVKIPLENDDFVVAGPDGNKNDYGKWKFTSPTTFALKENRGNYKKNRRGNNKQLEQQLTPSAIFARIYGFSYEGSYYELPKPVIFLVHTEGELASEAKVPTGGPRPGRAPRDTDLTGLAVAGFDFADELRVWSYDQADYTIRMDVETGMFEDVLLDAELDEEGWASGGRSGSGRSGSGRSGSGRSGSGRSGSGRSGSGRSGS